MDVVLDGPFELSGAAEDAAAELFFGEGCEPTFHEIEPRRTGGGEVKVESGAFGQPVLDEGCFVGLIVVEDEMDVEIAGDGLVNGVQEPTELHGTVAFVTVG